jgi:hypothetical protein
MLYPLDLAERSEVARGAKKGRVRRICMDALVPDGLQHDFEHGIMGLVVFHLFIRCTSFSQRASERDSKELLTHGAI